MTWDETKQTLNDRPDIVSERKLTSADWNDMVTDQKDHVTRHEDGGVDELSVQGLSGLLADPQTPNTEDVQDIVGVFTEAATGSNISVSYDDANDTLTIDTTALNPEETRDTVNNLLVGGTNTALTYDDVNDTLTVDVDAPTTAEFNDHSTRHENGGSDELSVTGLSGDLADEQDAKPHDIGGATHNADTLANLNSKVSDATLDDTNDQREPEAHTTTHQSGGTDEIPLNNLDLPAGAQIDEDGGDLVIRDSGGSIVLRRDEGAGTWDFVSGDLVNIASLEADDTNSKRLSSNYHYAGEYDGANADERLDAALTAATNGETVYLENDNYSQNRTIETELTIVGNSVLFSTQVEDAVWTLNAEVNLVGVTSNSTSTEFVIGNQGAKFTRCAGLGGTSVTVNADRFLMSSSHFFSVTFASGTSNGIVDGCVRTSVTDNGTNTVGDIA